MSGGTSADISLQGFQGAVALGYDAQVAPNWVLGVFGDYAFGEVDGNVGSTNFSIDNQWAVGARLGHVRSCCTMWYVTAGYTQADFDISSGGGSLSETLDGYFVGLGVEQALSQALYLKLEYRYSNYEDLTVGTTNIDNDVHSVRLGVNWKFGGLGFLR